MQIRGGVGSCRRAPQREDPDSRARSACVIAITFALFAIPRSTTIVVYVSVFDDTDILRNYAQRDILIIVVG